MGLFFAMVIISFIDIILGNIDLAIYVLLLGIYGTLAVKEDNNDND